ncbi:MAG TPA: hypothetical protein VFP00_06950, partial [Burkholderiales bacterium]|nr:hypothetical protein [Burkholderiales bacterium]
CNSRRQRTRRSQSINPQLNPVWITTTDAGSSLPGGHVKDLQQHAVVGRQLTVQGTFALPR